MQSEVWKETLIEQKVTYSLEIDGRFILIAHVPARVNIETGERFFAPETAERLQKTAWKQHEPSRTIETPVFEFTESA